MQVDWQRVYEHAEDAIAAGDWELVPFAAAFDKARHLVESGQVVVNASESGQVESMMLGLVLGVYYGWLS